MRKKVAKNYAEEIEKAIQEYESNRSYHQHTLSWISDRISWCWKFRKITRTQMEDFCDRMIVIFERS